MSTAVPHAPSTATRQGRASPRHLYIHVPFCREKCDYCGFYSVATAPRGDIGRRDAAFERFVEAAHAEWAAEAARFGVRRLETVYVGGGTPSLLGEERLERLLAPILDGSSPGAGASPLLTPHAEVTVETNPGDVSAGYAAWAATRRLRVSLGVQSFDPGLRAALGRRVPADPRRAFTRLREAGVANLGIDLLFGMPGQSLADVERELEAVARLRPDHISWYELDLIPGTSLARRVETGAGVIRRAGDEYDAEELNARLYRCVVTGLERLGYRWYEVSNFALPGRRSRHNLAYWRGRGYLGLGPSAVSTVGERRWRNHADLGAYLRAWGDRSSSPSAASTGREGNPGVVDRGSNARETERLDRATRARERLLLAARIGARVELSELAPSLDRAALQPLAGAGFVSLRGGTLSVTRKGRYVANEVCVRLFRDSFYGG